MKRSDEAIIHCAKARSRLICLFGDNLNEAIREAAGFNIFGKFRRLSKEYVLSRHASFLSVEA